MRKAANQIELKVYQIVELAEQLDELVEHSADAEVFLRDVFLAMQVDVLAATGRIQSAIKRLQREQKGGSDVRSQ
jgi:hypothetical protein